MGRSVNLTVQKYGQVKIESIQMNTIKLIYNKIKDNAIFIEIALFIIAVFWGFISGLFGLPDMVSATNELLNEHIDDYNSEKARIESRIDNLYLLNKTEEILTHVLYPTAESYMQNSNEEFQNMSLFSQNSTFIDETGNECNLSNYLGDSILIPYKENDQEIFFLGQIDSDYQWDGNCLINVYKDNQLVIATSAQYNNGIRESYTQIFFDDGEWVYTDRERKLDKTNKAYNSGDTWRYTCINNYIQKISFDSPSENDMITPSTFRQEFCESLISRYHGNVVDGKYNDTTGDAYLIKFLSDGTVKTLYHGNFKNGDFDDETGHAWYITRDKEKNTNYMYYMGEFRQGKTLNDGNSYFENPITRATFNRLTSNNIYDCYMNWAEQYIGD